MKSPEGKGVRSITEMGWDGSMAQTKKEGEELLGEDRKKAENTRLKNSR